MGQRLSHVAVTVPRAQLVGPPREALLDFYASVFGWRENPRLAIPGERIFLRAPSDTQYLTIRASDSPMQGSGAEHVGIVVGSEAELREIHARAAAMRERFPDLELEAVRAEYGGSLLTFRVRFRLPVSIEVQCLGTPDPERP